MMFTLPRSVSVAAVHVNETSSCLKLINHFSPGFKSIPQPALQRAEDAHGAALNQQGR